MICLIWGNLVLVNKSLLEIVTSVTYLCTCNPLLIKRVGCLLFKQKKKIINTNVCLTEQCFNMLVTQKQNKKLHRSNMIC